ncbi:MAG: DUF4175 family protein [Hymenobacteraceae bacterium]|nr:DUF4175 family protein [Hymenobacteraceae bacterium]
MSNRGSLEAVLEQLQVYKRKFYMNLLLKGSIFTAGLLLSFFLLYSLLEYYFYFPQYIRAFLFFSFIAICIYSFVRWIWKPVSALTNLKKLLTDEQAAQQVGRYYPEINDKLLNTLQLKALAANNDLVLASIEQKTGQLVTYQFSESVKYQENKPLLKYVAVPLLLVLGITLIYPSIFVQGTERIINYKKFYAPAAPFKFIIQNDQLQAYKNEDFTLKVAIEGKTIHEQVTVLYNGREQKLTKDKNNQYSYEFKRLQKPVEFQLAGSGFLSDEYTLNLLSRPNLKDFEVEVQYPSYLNKNPEVIQNTGNVTVPEGSKLTWQFSTSDTENLKLTFEKPQEVVQAKEDNNLFKAEKVVKQSQAYSVHLKNKHSQNKEEISYLITTIPDRHPEINIEQFRDTALYNLLVLGGNVADDYGLTKLNLHYRVSNPETGNATAYKVQPLRFDRKQLSQTYYHQWNISNMNLQPGDRLEYFVQAWDNDGVNGSKSARTPVLEFKVPSRRELEKELNSNAKSVESQMSKTLEQQMKLQQELAKTEEKMKTKRDLNWQDKKSLEEMVQKKKQLQSDIESLKEMFKDLNKKQERFDEQNPELAEKAQQLQKLMDELLDEETKKLYEELEKLLQEQRPKDEDLQKLLSKLENKESTLEKELERALELFKQLQFEQKLDQATKKLEELAKKEEQLSEKSQEKGADQNELKNQQQNLKEQFKDVQQQMKELKKLNEQLENQNPMEDTSGDEQEIEENMNDSQEQLSKQQNKKASQSQKKAAENMKKMAEKMEQMKNSMDMDAAQENMDDLRDILENLLKLSFDQEDLMKQFRQVHQSDPRFVALSQKQLKLKDDAKMIEDSLNALAKRVFQIQSFVTREVGLMNDHMDNAMQDLKDRHVPRATSHQQFAMTSINNLALMLNDALKQMQQQMAQQMKGQQQCNKPGGKPKPGEMGKMQQMLNDKISELKKEGKSGKALSEELAKLAAQQEILRKALQELEKQGQKEGGKQGNGQLSELKKLMEQSETDLVNKRLTEQTIMRQREILTRLLEAEKAAKERELDNKREAQSAKELARQMPPSFEKYIKAKEKQTELLKTISPSLSPYYKQEVNEYFQKIGN